MSKPSTTTKKPTTAVATNNPNVPAHLQDYQSTGVGVPTDQKDFLLPMAKVLDAKSPEVTKGHAGHIKGAEAGDIFIKNAPQQVYKGETGFLFQPCYRDAAVIEWLPRNKGGGGGGGFVARHRDDFLETSQDKEQRPHPENPSKLVWFRKSTGNLLVETRYYGGYLISESGEPPIPLVLPFASTGHTVAKQWNMLLAQKRLHNRPADIWLVYYRVTTRLKQRQDQAWYLFDIADAGKPDPETRLPTTLWVPTAADFSRGKLLHDNLASGAKQMDHEAATTTVEEEKM